MLLKPGDGEGKDRSSGAAAKAMESTRDTCTFARPHYPIAMLNLTRQEQTVMIFILVALLVGAGIRHLRINAMLPDRTAAYSGSTH